MERRTFLKVSLVAVGALAGRLAFPWAAAGAGGGAVSYGGALYRAGGGGKVLTSADGGKNWTLHSDLGDIYSVARLAGGSRLRMTVSYAGSTFGLMLAPNLRSWLTV